MLPVKPSIHINLGLALLFSLAPLCSVAGPQKVRGIVDLADGSRIVGTPVKGSISFQTEYATLELSLDRIRSISCKAKDREPIINLRNGDRLQGKPLAEALTLETSLGTLSIPFSKITLVTFLHEIPGAGEELVAYYPFSGNAEDESGNGRDGEIHGAMPDTDRFGSTNAAYRFDGGHTYIELERSADLTLTSGGFTVTAWVCPARENSDVVILAKHFRGHPNGYGIGITNNRFSFYVNSDPRLVEPGSVTPGTWYFVAGAYDCTNQYLYVNGTLTCSQPMAYTNTNDAPVTIGGMASGACLDGAVSDVRIYSRALTAEEIHSLYTQVSVQQN